MDQPVEIRATDIRRISHLFEIVQWICPVCNAQNVNSSFPGDREIMTTCESCQQDAEVTL